MTLSSTCQLVVAGTVTAGLSVTVIYLLRRFSKGKPTVKRRKSEKRRRGRNTVNYKEITILLSSSIVKAFALTDRLKSAGLNVVYLDHDTKEMVQSHDLDTFAYGNYRYRSAQDLTTGRTFMLQRCASDITNRSTETLESVKIPNIAEIFPTSVLTRVGICPETSRYEDMASDDSDEESSRISRKSSGKMVRHIRSRQGSQTSEPVVQLASGDLVGGEIVQNFEDENVRRFGSEFDVVYNRMYNDYRAVVLPNSPIITIHNSQT